MHKLTKVIITLTSLCLILLFSMISWFFYLINQESIVEEKKLSYGGMYKVTEHATGITGGGTGYSIYFRLHDDEKYRKILQWELTSNLPPIFDYYEDEQLVVFISPKSNRLPSDAAIYILNKDPNINRLNWKLISLSFPEDIIKDYRTYTLLTTLDEEALSAIHNSRKNLTSKKYMTTIRNFNLKTRKILVSYPFSEDKEQTLQFQLSKYGTRMRLMNITINNRLK